MDSSTWTDSVKALCAFAKIHLQEASRTTRLVVRCSGGDEHAPVDFQASFALLVKLIGDYMYTHRADRFVQQQIAKVLEHMVPVAIVHASVLAELPVQAAIGRLFCEGSCKTLQQELRAHRIGRHDTVPLLRKVDEYTIAEVTSFIESVSMKEVDLVGASGCNVRLTTEVVLHLLRTYSATRKLA